MRFKIIILLILIVLLAGCIESGVSMNGKESTIELDEIEIREYEGERLSSANDFRENSIKGIQRVDIEDYKLKIHGLVETPQEYLYDEVIDRQTYSKVVTLNCVEGWSATSLWEGVLFEDLVEDANPLGTANTVIFHAYDGYTSALPLDYLIDNNIMIAYKMNNMTLPEERGFPFQVVAEQKFGYKWVKWITEIEFTDDENYEGFWESRGYDNDADLK